MKGIVLAGGSGTRLYPLTVATSKQLLPVYDKPVIFYSLSILMLSGIRDILIISTPHDLPQYEKLLGTGEALGLRLSYAEQASPDGIAQAFLIGEDFIGSDSVALILGDNIFYGNGLKSLLKKAVNNTNRATIFGYYVEDPERFGVIEFDEHDKVISIEEKPKSPKSNYAVTGLYFYDNRVVQYAKQITPSARGELEITDINQHYLAASALDVTFLGRGFAWMDVGTVETLIAANNFVKIIEDRQNIKIAALEEIAYKNKWITKDALIEITKKYNKTAYGKHLMKVAEGKFKY